MAIENNDERLQGRLDAALGKKDYSDTGGQSAAEKRYRRLYRLLQEDDSPTLAPDFNRRLLQRVENYQQTRSLKQRFYTVILLVGTFAVFLGIGGGETLPAQWQNDITSWVTPFLGPFKYDYLAIVREAFAGLNISFSALFLAGLAIFIVFIFDELFFQKKSKAYNLISHISL